MALADRYSEEVLGPLLAADLGQLQRELAQVRLDMGRVTPQEPPTGAQLRALARIELIESVIWSRENPEGPRAHDGTSKVRIYFCAAPRPGCVVAYCERGQKVSEVVFGVTDRSVWRAIYWLREHCECGRRHDRGQEENTLDHGYALRTKLAELDQGEDEDEDEG